MENKKEAFQMSNIKKVIFDHAIYVVLVILLVLVGGRKIFCVYGKNSSLIRNRYV